MPFRQLRAESEDASPRRKSTIETLMAAGESLDAAIERRLNQNSPLTTDEIGAVLTMYDGVTESLKKIVAQSQPATTGKEPDHFSIQAFATMPKLIRNRNMPFYWQRFRRLVAVSKRDLRYALACQWERGEYRNMVRCAVLTATGITLLLWGGCLAAMGFRRSNVGDALKLIHRALNPVLVMPSTSLDYC